RNYESITKSTFECPISERGRLNREHEASNLRVHRISNTFRNDLSSIIYFLQSKVGFSLPRPRRRVSHRPRTKAQRTWASLQVRAHRGFWSVDKTHGGHYRVERDGFSWDDDKAARNLRDHRVSFEQAVVACRDPFALEWIDTSQTYGEERWC